MALKANRRLGFTLIEVLVSIVLLGVGVAGINYALGQMAQASARLEEGSRSIRLGARKLDELIASGEAAIGNASGDFSPEGFPNLAWQLTSEPTGVENLNSITLTITNANANNEDGKELTTLLYLPAPVEQ